MEYSKRLWFYDGGEIVWISLSERIVFMPYDREPETYGPQVKSLIKGGYVVQLETV